MDLDYAPNTSETLKMVKMTSLCKFKYGPTLKSKWIYDKHVCFEILH